MIAPAWNNGSHWPSGGGYGIKINRSDRDSYFDRSWKHITLELVDSTRNISVEVNVDKASFWGPRCRELINQEIGRWLIRQKLAPWPKDAPPQINIEHISGNRFRAVAM